MKWFKRMNSAGKRQSRFTKKAGDRLKTSAIKIYMDLFKSYEKEWRETTFYEKNIAKDRNFTLLMLIKKSFSLLVDSLSGVKKEAINDPIITMKNKVDSIIKESSKKEIQKIHKNLENFLNKKASSLETTLNHEQYSTFKEFSADSLSFMTFFIDENCDLGTIKNTVNNFQKKISKRQKKGLDEKWERSTETEKLFIALLTETHCLTGKREGNADKLKKIFSIQQLSANNFNWSGLGGFENENDEGKKLPGNLKENLDKDYTLSLENEKLVYCPISQDFFRQGLMSVEHAVPRRQLLNHCTAFIQSLTALKDNETLGNLINAYDLLGEYFAIDESNTLCIKGYLLHDVQNERSNLWPLARDKNSAKGAKNFLDYFKEKEPKDILGDNFTTYLQLAGTENGILGENNETSDIGILINKVLKEEVIIKHLDHDYIDKANKRNINRLIEKRTELIKGYRIIKPVYSKDFIGIGEALLAWYKKYQQKTLSLKKELTTNLLPQFFELGKDSEEIDKSHFCMEIFKAFLKQLSEKEALSPLKNKASEKTIVDYEDLQQRVEAFFSKKVNERKAAKAVKDSVANLLLEAENVDDMMQKEVGIFIEDLRNLCKNHWRFLPTDKKTALLKWVDKATKALDAKQCEKSKKYLGALLNNLEEHISMLISGKEFLTLTRQCRSFEKEIETIKKEAETIKKEAETAKKEAETIKKEAETAKKEAETAKKEAETANKRISLLEEQLKILIKESRKNDSSAGIKRSYPFSTSDAHSQKKKQKLEDSSDISASDLTNFSKNPVKHLIDSSPIFSSQDSPTNSDEDIEEKKADCQKKL